MRYIKSYRVFESDDRRNEVKNQAKAAIPEFIIKMSEYETLKKI